MQTSPGDALDFAEKELPPGEERTQAVKMALQSWLYSDPQAAVAYAAKSADTKPDDLRELARNWAHQDPDGALTWARGQPTVLARDAYVSGAMSGLANHDLQRAAKLLAQVLPGDLQRKAAADIAGSWAAQDPAQAAAWAAQLASEQSRRDAASRFAQVWALQEPAQAAAWIERMPPGTMRDSAVGAFADQVAGVDPAGAIQWAETIADETRRENVLKRNFDRWRRSDEPAAEAWLASKKTLTDSFRKRLQAK
jgi:hypothetical protein